MNLPPELVSNGLTCRTIAQQSSAYLDDALPAVMKLRMACHLSTCQDCRRYVRQISLVRVALGTLPKCQPSSVKRRALRERFSSRYTHEVTPSSH